MKIFSSHRRKLEPSRRFGGRVFQNKIKAAANYKRGFSMPRLSFSWKFWRWIGYLTAAFFIYFFILSSHLVIADVSVSGNSQVTTQQIQDTISEYANSRVIFIKKGNFIFMTQGRVNSLLKAKLPMIKDVSEYHRIWPNKISLTVTERSPGFVIKSNNKYFLVDDEGTVIKSLDNPDKYLVAEDSVVEDFGTGESLPNAKLASFIISMSKTWPTKLNTSVSLVKFAGKAADSVQFVSAEGWSVLFDINRPAAAELTDLVVILNKQIQAKGRTNLAYIDLRIDKWAYYCYNNSPCSQQALPDKNATK